MADRPTLTPEVAERVERDRKALAALERERLDELRSDPEVAEAIYRLGSSRPHTAAPWLVREAARIVGRA